MREKIRELLVLESEKLSINTEISQLDVSVVFGMMNGGKSLEESISDVVKSIQEIQEEDDSYQVVF